MKHCPNPECPDLLAHGRPGEYRDEIESCPYCGTPLRWGPAPEPAGGGEGELPPVEELRESDGELARVGHFTDHGEAELARGFLEAQGIPARIARDAAGGNRPVMGAMLGIRLLVPASLAAEAEALLAATEDVEQEPPGRPE